MSDYKDLLRRANETLAMANAKKLAQSTEDRKMMMAMFGQDLVEAIKPAIEAMQVSKEDLVEALSNVKISAPIEQPEITVTVPPIEVPEAHVTVDMPEIRVPAPIVNYTPPQIKIPELSWPSENMPIEGWVRLQGVDLQNPLPVQLRDKDGKPVSLVENLTQIISAGSGKIGLTDTQLRGSSIPVSQVSGASWTVSSVDLDIRDLVNATDSVSAYQVSGHRWSTEATQSGTWTVTTASGSLATVTGDIVSDDVDTSTAPVKVGGIARTANPTAVGGGDRVSASYDDLGRVLTRPIQVRDLTLTARASLSTGSEATLLAAVAGAYLDCVAVMCANESDAAVTIDLRAVTAGNIVQSIRVPANGTAGWVPPIPWPQDETGNNWTVDMADITGTTVLISAIFSREV